MLQSNWFRLKTYSSLLTIIASFIKQKVIFLICKCITGCVSLNGLHFMYINLDYLCVCYAKHSSGDSFIRQLHFSWNGSKFRTNGSVLNFRHEEIVFCIRFLIVLFLFLFYADFSSKTSETKTLIKTHFKILFWYCAVNYVTWFNKFPGQTILPKLDVVYQRVGTADQCASLCFNYLEFPCKSFDYCELIQTCVIGHTHIFDIPKSQVNFEPMCSHYSSKKSFLIYLIKFCF